MKTILSTIPQESGENGYENVYLVIIIVRVYFIKRKTKID